MHYSHVWGNFLLVSFSDFLVAPSTNCEGNEKERKKEERKKENDNGCEWWGRFSSVVAIEKRMIEDRDRERD